MISKFTHCNVHVKYQLLRSYCMCVYGSSLWDFADPSTETFYVAWRKCIRRLLGVPNTTHCRLLPLILGDLPVQQQLHCRFTKFFSSCLRSDNSLIRLCSTLALNGSQSSVGNSITYLCETYDLIRDAWPQRLKIQPEARDTTSAAIRDFIALRDASHDEDITFIMKVLCTE